MKEFIKFGRLSREQASSIIEYTDQGMSLDEIIKLMPTKIGILGMVFSNIEMKPGEIEGETPYKAFVQYHRPSLDELKNDFDVDPMYDEAQFDFNFQPIDQLKHVVFEDRELAFGFFPFDRRVNTETGVKQIFQRGFRPATLEEGIAFVRAYPELDGRIGILGSQATYRKKPLTPNFGPPKDGERTLTGTQVLKSNWLDARANILVVRNETPTKPT